MRIAAILDVRHRGNLSVLQYQILFVPKISIVKDEESEHIKLWIDPERDLEDSESLDLVRAVLANRPIRDRVEQLRRVEAIVNPVAAVDD